MGVFATEFRVSPDITQVNFLAQIVAWIKGIQESTVFHDVAAKDLDDDDAFIEASSGETLSVKKVVTQSGFVIGAKYEIPDEEGRIWRTEVVLTNSSDTAKLRIRGQCVAITAEVPVSRPKMPFILKSVLEEGWGESDGGLKVQALPHSAAEHGTDFICKLLKGEANCALPIVYLSINPEGRYDVSPEYLARKLGGVAHVVKEPSRSFSFTLSRESLGINPFDGNVTISTSGSGVVRRFFLGGRLPTMEKLSSAVEDAAIVAAANKNILGGWSWRDLQEQQSRNLKKKIKDANGGSDKYAEVFDKELEQKEKEISELRAEVERLSNAQYADVSFGDGLMPSELVDALGDELYPGEFSDRLRYLVKIAQKNMASVDLLTTSFSSIFIEITSSSGRSVGIIADLKAASKKGKRFGPAMAQVLNRLGYVITEDGKHIKASPPSGPISGQTLTLPKTASDNARGGANQVSDIESALGLKFLK